MSQVWYIRHNNKTFGPYTPAKLKQLAGTAKIATATEVRLGDDGKWVPAGKVKGLFQQVVPQRTTVANRQDKKRSELVELQKQSKRSSQRKLVYWGLLVSAFILIPVVIATIVNTRPTPGELSESRTDHSPIVQKVSGQEPPKRKGIARNPETPTVRALREKAESGDAIAQRRLGGKYATGDGVPTDYGEAFAWSLKSAQQRDALAQCNIATMYNNGYGVPQDIAEAVKWYRKAAEQGLDNAQYSLGVMYADGTGVPQDYFEAVKWYRRSAEQGKPEALCNLGVMYANGHGLPQDKVEAVARLILAVALAETNGSDQLPTMIGANEHFREQLTIKQRLESLERAKELKKRINAQILRKNVQILKSQSN